MEPLMITKTLDEWMEKCELCSKLVQALELIAVGDVPETRAKAFADEALVELGIWLSEEN